MTRPSRVLLVALLAAIPAAARAQESPHHMTLPNGKLNMDLCPVCHNPDMSLQRSELETCTLCHSESSHGGSLEHVHATPEQVKEVVAGRAKDAVKLPLTKEGRIYCGTCHLFHDPAVLGEKWLETGWVPPDAGFPGAVREGVEERWTALEKEFEKGPDSGRFATQGTRQLRAPAANGSLCLQCHRSLP